MGSAGDRYRVERSVPLFSAFLHDPLISLAGVPRCGTRTALLHSEPGNVAIAVADFGACVGQFTARGTPVGVGVGNEIAVDFASDARMTVPAMIESVELATDLVTGSCFPGRPYLLQVFSGTGKDGGRFRGVAEPDGAIVLDTSDHPTERPVDIVDNHDIRLSCVSPKGDSIRHDVTTPP